MWRPTGVVAAVLTGVVAVAGLGLLAAMQWSQAGLDERLEQEAAELGAELEAMEDPVMMILSSAAGDPPDMSLHLTADGIVAQRLVQYGLFAGCVEAELPADDTVSATTRTSCTPAVGASQP